MINDNKPITFNYVTKNTETDKDYYDEIRKELWKCDELEKMRHYQDTVEIMQMVDDRGWFDNSKNKLAMFTLYDKKYEFNDSEKISLLEPLYKIEKKDNTRVKFNPNIISKLNDDDIYEIKKNYKLIESNDETITIFNKFKKDEIVSEIKEVFKKYFINSLLMVKLDEETIERSGFIRNLIYNEKWEKVENNLLEYLLDEIIHLYLNHYKQDELINKIDKLFDINGGDLEGFQIGNKLYVKKKSLNEVINKVVDTHINFFSDLPFFHKIKLNNGKFNIIVENPYKSVYNNKAERPFIYNSNFHDLKIGIISVMNDENVKNELNEFNITDTDDNERYLKVLPQIKHNSEVNQIMKIIKIDKINKDDNTGEIIIEKCETIANYTKDVNALKIQNLKKIINSDELSDNEFIHYSYLLLNGILCHFNENIKTILFQGPIDNNENVIKKVMDKLKIGSFEMNGNCIYEIDDKSKIINLEHLFKEIKINIDEKSKITMGTINTEKINVDGMSDQLLKSFLLFKNKKNNVKISDSNKIFMSKLTEYELKKI